MDDLKAEPSNIPTLISNGDIEEKEANHLVVFIHGLGGGSLDFSYMKEELVKLTTGNNKKKENDNKDNNNDSTTNNQDQLYVVKQAFSSPPSLVSR